MDALDGYALAGPLFDYYDHEMTTVVGNCDHCGTPSQIAERVVYSRAPEAVVRCPHCTNIVMVVVRVRGTQSVDSTAFRMVERQA